MEDIKLASSTEENIAILIQKASFWAVVFRLKGTYANIITSSPSYVKAKTAFLDAKRCLEVGCLRQMSINTLHQSKKELEIMCESGIILKDDLLKLVQDSFNEKNRMFDVVKQCCNLFSHIEKQYRRNGNEEACELLSSSMCRLLSEEEEFKKNQMHLNKFKNTVANVLETSDASLPHSWNTLFHLLDSRLFWNLEFRKKTMYSFKTATELVTVLAKEGLVRYEEVWGKSTITLREVRKIFPEDIQIENEYKRARAILPAVIFPMSHLSVIKNFTKTEEEFIKRLQEVLEVLSLSDIDIDFNEAVDVMEGMKETDVILAKDIRDISGKLEYLLSLRSQFDDEFSSVFDVLSTSESLIAFLKPILTQDLTYLVDAVEEFVEHVVPYSAVPLLIIVKSFFQRLLEANIKSVRDFLDIFSDACESISADAITTCNRNLSGLKALYHGLSDKKALAKQSIQSILNHGVVHYKQVRKHSVVCEIYVTFEENRGKRKDSRAEDDTKSYRDEDWHGDKVNQQKLQDLRSQALFIANYRKPFKSESREEEQNRTKMKMEQFVNFVDQIMRISQLVDHLQDLGHFEFGSVDKSKRILVKDLSEEEKRLEIKTLEWTNLLEVYREKYVWLNYIYGEQLQKMEKFLRTTENASEIEAILKYIHADVSMHISRREPFALDKRTDESVLDNIGKYLCLIFDKLETVPKKFKIKQTSTKLKDTIAKGRLAIVCIGNEHEALSKTILALYLNTTNTLPEPHQLIICDHTTHWSEVNLLLKRCTIAGQENRDSVYCIASVQALSSDMQSRLAREIKVLEERTEGNFRLGLISKGSTHESFLQFFRNNIVEVDEIAILTASEMSDCVRQHCKGVHIVHSEVPGLGKTEWIKSFAMKNRFNVITYHISGTFTKRTLIQGLNGLHLSRSTLLHIDIGEMDRSQSELLDNFIFEMMILRSVTSGTMTCALSTRNICIEIPNSCQDHVRKNLSTLSHFETVELNKHGFLEHFIANQEHKSSLQIVCKYLLLYDSGELDDKEKYLSMRKSKDSLSSEKCKELLQKYFIDSKTTSYDHINIFVKILGEQLKKFSKSTFVRNCEAMVKVDIRKLVTIRSTLLKTLIEHATEMTTLQGTSKAKAVAQMTRGTSTEIVDYMAEREKSIVRWENGVNFMIVFNFDGHTITPLYRGLGDVPPDMKEFFGNQMNHQLPESIYAYEPNKQDLMSSQDELQKKLQRIVCAQDTTTTEYNRKCDKKYIVTPDNMLKMVMMYQRLQANLPVVIVGETGCGKTSLIRYLANISNTEITVYNIHAGLSAEDICNEIKNVNTKAREKLDKQIWFFMDEINTSKHLGIISDAICHGRIFGENLAPNIRMITACNPYRLRTPHSILTEGLDPKIKEYSDEISRLVYRVHPLPETMMSHVWDFGAVNATDEKVYIRRMLENTLNKIPSEKRSRITIHHKEIFGDLLLKSQREIREFEKEDFSVSLRDVDRCIRLFPFFMDFIEKKEASEIEKNGAFDIEKMGTSHTNLILKAMILSLTHCYYYRLKNEEKHRKCYREILANVH